MTPGGQIRFWQSLASGLAGGEHWIPAWLDLQEHEQVTTLTRADVSIVIVLMYIVYAHVPRPGHSLKHTLSRLPLVVYSASL